MARRSSPPKDAPGRKIDLRPISGTLELIERDWHPIEVWLFGSRARGEAEKDSEGWRGWYAPLASRTSGQVSQSATA